MSNLQEKFVWVLVALATLNLLIPINLSLLSTVRTLNNQINEIKALDKKPQTKCRLITPFTYEMKEGILYVPVKYFSLNKTYDAGTLIYPVIATDEDNQESWLFSLQSEFECRMLSTSKTLFNYLPNTKSFVNSMTWRLMAMIPLGLATIGAFCVAIHDVRDIYVNLGERHCKRR